MILSRLKHKLGFTREETGATAIEFGFIAPFFLLVVIASIEFMTVLWEQYTLNYAVSLAARHVFVEPDRTSSEIETYVRNRLPVIPGSPSFTITVTPSVEANISVSLTHSFLFYPGDPIVLNANIIQPLSPVR